MTPFCIMFCTIIGVVLTNQPVQAGVPNECEDIAKFWFEADRSGVASYKTDGGVVISVYYQGSFSVEKGKCFVAIQIKRVRNTDNYSGSSLELIDPVLIPSGGYYRRQIGYYDMNITDQKPNYCFVNDAKCSSEQEWRKLAKPFLDE